MARPLTATAYGDLTFNSTTVRTGTYSAEFDGTDDYIIVSSDPGFNVGTGNFTLEFWIYPRDIAVSPARDWLWHQATGLRVLMQRDSIAVDGKLVVSFNNVSFTSTLTGNALIDINQWNKITIRREGNTLGAYVGTSGSTINCSGLDMQSTTDAYIGIDSTPNQVSDFDGFIDELRFSNTNRTLSTSTSAWKNDGNTVLLLHFENDLTDDIEPAGQSSLSASAALTAAQNPNPSMVFIRDDYPLTWDDTDTWERIGGIQDSWWPGYRFPQIDFTITASGDTLDFGQADISSEFGLSASAGYRLDGSADLSSSAQFISDASVVRNAGSQLDSQFDITSTSLVARGGLASLTADSDLSAESTITLVGHADLSTVFDTTIQGRILKLADIEIQDFASLSATAEVEINASADLSATTDTSVRGGFLIEINETFEYTWDTIDPDQWDSFLKDQWGPTGWFAFDNIQLTATSSQTTEGQAQLSAEFQTNIIGVGVKIGSADFTAVLDLESQANITRSVSADLNTESALSAQAVNLKITGADLTVQSDLTAFGGRILSASALIEEAMNFEISADKLVRSAADLIVSSDIRAFPTLIPNVIIDPLASDTELTAGANLIKNVSAQLEAFGFEVVAGERFVGGRADIIAVSDMLVNGGSIFNGRANLEALAFEIADGRISDVRGSADLSAEFHGVFAGDLRLLDSEFMLKILPENRRFMLLDENRQQPINRDTRTWHLPPESGILEILSETRRLDVAKDLIS